MEELRRKLEYDVGSDLHFIPLPEKVNLWITTFCLHRKGTAHEVSPKT